MADGDPQTMKEMIDGNVQSILSANGALSRLWRITCYKQGISAIRWEHLLTEYWHEDTRREGKVDKSLKGNLQKGILESDMSWRSFCRGVTVLNYKEAVLTIRLKEDNIETSLDIIIPKTYRQPVGSTLAWAWGEVLNQWPERKDNWKYYLKDYADWTAESMRMEDSVDYRSSMARAMGGSTLMWNRFYKGLCALNFDAIELELVLTHPRKKEKEFFLLKMPNTKKRPKIKTGDSK